MLLQELRMYSRWLSVSSSSSSLSLRLDCTVNALVCIDDICPFNSLLLLPLKDPSECRPPISKVHWQVFWQRWLHRRLVIRYCGGWLEAHANSRDKRFTSEVWNLIKIAEGPLRLESWHVRHVRHDQSLSGWFVMPIGVVGSYGTTIFA